MAASPRKATAGATAPNINTAAQIFDTPTESTSSICHLLGLPAELRLEIYETIIANTPRPSAANKTLEPSIMSTCHQVRAEMILAYGLQICDWEHQLLEEVEQALDEAEVRIAADPLSLETVREARKKAAKISKPNLKVRGNLKSKFKSLLQELMAQG